MKISNYKGLYILTETKSGVSSTVAVAWDRAELEKIKAKLEEEKRYTYTANSYGYTVYKDGQPIHSASVLNAKKRYNKKDVADNRSAAEAHIRYCIAMDKYQEATKQKI